MVEEKGDHVVLLDIVKDLYSRLHDGEEVVLRLGQIAQCLEEDALVEKATYNCCDVPSGL